MLTECNGVDRSLGRGLKVGIVEDNEWRLSTQFERDRLEVGFGCSLHNGPACTSGSGEANTSVKAMVGQSSSPYAGTPEYARGEAHAPDLHM